MEVSPSSSSSGVPLILILCLSSFFLPPVICRGGESLPLFRSGSLNGSYSVNTRRILKDDVEAKDTLAKGYMTNSDLEHAVKAFGRRCGNISRIYSIGKSFNGVPLWVIEISDNPGKEEAKPAFKFVGNVHGDEPVGRELLIILANWICDNYVRDPLAKFIVENVHLHILPTMNPDGFSLRKRGNANNIDLNRDFPDQFFSVNNVISARQPETRAIMKWLKEVRFTASASLHGGALVANYPWDGTEDKRKHYYACPDDETFRFLASTYSHFHYNMSSSKEFPEGITNGASWYPIYGGMQDYNYIHAGCLELTLEISDDKWPAASELPTLWEYNKMSMLHLAASVAKRGIHGRIYSSNNGGPLPGAISINGINYTVEAGKAFADYHRLLAPDNKYEVLAFMHGYKPKNTTVFLEGGAMSLDFVLDPETGSLRETKVKGWCDCNCNAGIQGVELTGFAWWTQSQLYFLVVVVTIFILIFLGRRFSFLKYRQLGSPKRTMVMA
ncbi:hypothetical protein MLD38_022651 [Melastoma candidum]|uniref:Uncharacterized protein n=1 Tax=Melastoma candidum TaxID=119954 RepID=A0ACB9QL59_9MYRT|nr:hypothetical protein MLD38_022651 [Melastoma candidum]